MTCLSHEAPTPEKEMPTREVLDLRGSNQPFQIKKTKRLPEAHGLKAADQQHKKRRAQDI